MAQQERGGFERRTRERDWPLPSRGWFGPAERAEVDPAFAARLENLWWRDGVLRQRPGYEITDQSIARQRITHALTGGAPKTITVYPSYVKFESSVFARNTSSRLMHASISNHTVMVGGGSPPLRFNGEVLSAPTFTADGAALSDLDGVIAHHDRLYFWRTNGALEFWYGGLGAVEGEIVRFPLDRLGNIEGGIACMGRHTSDAGDNVNDLLVILTTAGDVVIYQGTDPGLADDWRIWGRLKVAAPVNRYAMLNYGADLFVLTTQGVVSIGQAMGRGAPALLEAMTKPIADELSRLIKLAPDSFRWQMITDEAQQVVIVNTPFDRALVFGAQSGAWFDWTGIPALNWRRRGRDLLMTKTNGHECLFGADTGDEGQPIRSTWWSPWVRSVGPHVATIRPMIYSAGPLSLAVSVLADHAATQRDVDETAQDVAVLPENETDLAAQSHGEAVMVGITGEALQLRLSFSAVNAEIAAVRWMG